MLRLNETGGIFVVRSSVARRLAATCIATTLLLGSTTGALAQTRLQAQNKSTAAGAATGPTVGANFNGFVQGPVAASAFSASAQQRGTNRADMRQSGQGKSGDAVAGSQVAAATGSATVQQTNDALAVVAVSGLTAFANFMAAAAGPVAVALAIPFVINLPDGTAIPFGVVGGQQSSQMGDNIVNIVQDPVADTGDAVAGAQVTGIADAEWARVANTNNAVIAVGLTRNSTSANILAVAVGPQAGQSTQGGIGLVASASQTGSNELTAEQDAVATTGDAVGGSQITGVVGEGRPFEVMNSNSTFGVLVVAGTTLANNFAATQVGPQVLADAIAQIQQTGDNASDVTQSVEATSGDAVGSSQVTGLVGEDDADLEIVQQQRSVLDLAISAPATATNVLLDQTGPSALGVLIPQSLLAYVSQNGNNDATTSQTSSAASATAMTGSQVSGAVAGDDSKIAVSVTNSAPRAFALGLSGQAVSGSQITGAVAGDDSDVTLSKQNSAQGLGVGVALALVSGATNIETVTAGPAAVAQLQGSAMQTGDNAIHATQVTNDVNTATLTAGPVAAVGNPAIVPVIGDASASQHGNDLVELSQEAASASGDAVSGAQVTGVAVGDRSHSKVQASLQSVFPIAITGDIPVANTATVNSGPKAAVFITSVLGTARAQQFGDANASVTQTIDASTGDAVAGAQIAGVVGGDTKLIQQANSTLIAFGLSGTANSNNTALGLLGPTAAAVVVSNASQVGSTGHELSQTFSSESGDMVSGGQIVGAA